MIGGIDPEQRPAACRGPDLRCITHAHASLDVRRHLIQAAGALRLTAVNWAGYRFRQRSPIAEKTALFRLNSDEVDIFYPRQWEIIFRRGGQVTESPSKNTVHNDGTDDWHRSCFTATWSIIRVEITIELK